MRDCLPKQAIAGKRLRRDVVVGTQTGQFQNPNLEPKFGQTAS